MRPGGGKGKGGAFERLICVLLSLWVSDGKRRDLFWRSAMSGGRATRGRARGEDLAHQAGDLSAVHPWGHRLTDTFFIECKFVRNLQFDRLLFGEGLLAQFWKTAIEQASNHKRSPMVIAKENRGDIVVLMHPDSLLSHLQIPFVRLDILHRRKNRLVAFPDVIIVRLDDILKEKFRYVLRTPGNWKK